MAKCTVSEHSSIPSDAAGNPLQIFRKPRRAKGYATGAATASSLPFQEGTVFVRFAADVSCHVSIGDDNDTATADDDFVAAGGEIIFARTEDQTKLSWVQA